jgi:hypothetical protein
MRTSEGVLAAACALLAPYAALADALTLHGDALDLNIGANAQGQSASAPAVQGQADLTGRFSGALQAGVHLQIQASDNQAEAWASPLAPTLSASPANASNSGKLGFNAAWTPAVWAKLQLDLNNEFHRSLQWAAPYLAMGEDQAASTRQSSARASMSLQPVQPLMLQLGGETTRDIEQTLALSPDAPAAFTRAETSTQRAFTAAKWTLIPQLSFEGGGAAETVQVGWRGADAAAQSYAYLTPRAAANLAAWPGGRLQFSVERVVSPVNAVQFGSFIDTADHPATAAFQPDHEWRYTGRLQQNVAGVDLSASYIRALLQSVTDFGPAGAGQAPMSIGGGERSQFDIGLNAPLAVVGLPSATLTGKATWRDSRVIDPFTQTPRRLSGETPYQAEINLAQSLPGAHVRLGVKAQVSGAQSMYQMSQLSTLSPTGGLGGFLDYKTGGVAIHLQLDNLLGGARTDREIYFIGSRSLDDPDRSVDTRQDSRAFAISLQKPF